jgi:oligopeptide transport system substrate-binding protein
MIASKILPAFALVLSLCAGAAQAAPPPDEVRRWLEGEPESIDPHKTEGIPEFHVQQDLFEGLTTFSADGRPAPGAAARWDVSADGKLYVFHLRPGLVWSNGEPLTSADFLYSLRRAVAPSTASPYAGMLSPIVNAEAISSGREKDLSKLGVEAPDPLTVRIALTHAAPYFTQLLAVQIGMPVPRKIVEQYGAKWTQPEHIVGNGPFLLKEWVPQGQIALERNPRFHDADQVKLARVRWVVDPEPATAFKKFRSGDLDTANVPPEELAWAKQNLSAELHSDPVLVSDYIVVNLTRPPFAGNLKLRQALALAMDQRVLNQKVVPLDREPAFGLVPSWIGGGYSGPTAAYKDLTVEERRARAKALFAEAGYGPDKPLEISILYPSEKHLERKYLALAAMWKQSLGVSLKLVNREWQVYVAGLRGHEFDLSMRAWFADYADPTTFLNLFRRDAGELNAGGYDNPAYDALLDRAAATADPAKRAELLAKAEQLLLDDQALLPDDFRRSLALVSPRVKGWVPNPMYQHLSRYLSIAE